MQKTILVPLLVNRPNQPPTSHLDPSSGLEGTSVPTREPSFTGVEKTPRQTQRSSGRVVLDIMGCSPKLRHKVVLAVIGCGARMSLLSFLFTSLFSKSSLPQR